MNKAQNLPKTQAAALEILKSLGGQATFDDWAAAGGNINAFSGLRKRGIVTITQSAGAGTYRIA